MQILTLHEVPTHPPPAIQYSGLKPVRSHQHFLSRFPRPCTHQTIVRIFLVFSLLVLILLSLFIRTHSRYVPIVVPFLDDSGIKVLQQETIIKVSPKRRFSTNIPAGQPVVFEGPKNERQRKVIKGFLHAWKGYKLYAWGHDELLPVSKQYRDWMRAGLTIIDSLDTLWIMGLKKEFKLAKMWVREQLTFDEEIFVNFFETTIRILGGLLSAYHLSGDAVFAAFAVDLGERLLAAFNTPSGFPMQNLHLRKNSSEHSPKWALPLMPVAEASTFQLEFNDLAHISGREIFQDLAANVSKQLHNLDKLDGLVPFYIDTNAGKFRTSGVLTLGAGTDSHYEYLIKQWIQNGYQDNWLRDDFIEAINGARKHLIRQSEPNGLTFVGEMGTKRDLRAKMDELACFLPGTLALAYMNGLSEDHLDLAESLLDTCHEMHTRTATHLAPDVIHFRTASQSLTSSIPADTNDMYIHPQSAFTLLRPEFVESLFYVYRATGNETYREWGWEFFTALEQHAKVPTGGYSSIRNVNSTTVTFDDRMESFVLAETFKYLYLLFGNEDVVPLERWVFNTEAHPLPIRNAEIVD